MAGTADELVRKSMVDAIGAILRSAGRSVPDSISDANSFGELDLDSLDLAQLVVALEAELNVDPFRSGATPVRTFGELLAVYVSAVAASEG